MPEYVAERLRGLQARSPTEIDSGSRGAARTVTPDQVLKLIPISGIARVKLDTLTGAPGNVVLATLKQLEAEGRARREGERGATRWYPVTDQDPYRSTGRRAPGNAPT